MNKKILFVINTLGHAGAEMAIVELLRRMGSEEYDIYLYVLTGQGNLPISLPEHVKLLNTRFDKTSVHTKEGSRRLLIKVLGAGFRKGSFIRRMPYLLRNLRAMVRKGKIQMDKLSWRILSDGAKRFPETYDLAVAYLEGGAAYYVAEHVKAYKKAAFIHTDYEASGYTRELDLDCYREYDRIFTVSEEAKGAFLKVYPEYDKIINVFHNIIDRERMLQRGKEPGGFSDTYEGFRILSVGRLVHEKAYDCAVETMKLLKEEGYEARWYVLGEGDQRKALEKQIEELGLKEDFILLGAVSNPYPYYSQTQLYVHAARVEGKSIAAQEAQIFGCPMIASDCSGNRGQITDGVDGILCEPTPEKIKEAIVVLMSNPKMRERLGKRAEERYSASYSPEDEYSDVQMLTGLLDG